MDFKRDNSTSSFEAKVIEDADIKYGEPRSFEISRPLNDEEALTRSFKMKLKGRQEAVRALSFIPASNGRNAMIIAGREDKIAVLWDLDSGVEAGKLIDGHSDQISCIFVLTRSNGDVIVITGSDDCSLVMWNITTFKPIMKISAHSFPIASVIAFEVNDSSTGSREPQVLTYLISAAINGSAAIWNLDTGEKLSLVDVEGEVVFNSLTYYTRLGDTRPSWAVGGDESITFWSVQGRLLARIDESSQQLVVCYSARDASSEKSPVLISLNKEGSAIIVVNLMSMKTINKIEHDLVEPLRRIAVCPSPSGFNILASSFNTVQVFEMLTGSGIDTVFQGGHGGAIMALYYYEYKGGGYILTGGADAVCIWSTLENTKPLNRISSASPIGHCGLVTAVATHVDHIGITKVITASSDLSAIVWDLETGNQELVLGGGHAKGIRAIACFSSIQLAQKPVVFTVGSDALIIKWDLQTGKLLKIVGGMYPHTEAIRAIAIYSITGEHPVSVTVGEDYKVCCYDWETESVMWLLTDVHMDNIVAVDVKMMTFNSVRVPVVLTGSDEMTAKFIRDGILDETSLTGHAGAISAVALLSAPNSDQHFALTSGADAMIMVWDVVTKLRLRVIPTMQAEITSLTVYFETGGKTHDGSPPLQFPCIVSGSKDKTACIWDLVTGNRIRIFEGGHSREVSSVTVLRLNQHSHVKHSAIILITAGFDNSAIVWDLNNCEKSTLLSGKGHLETVVKVSVPNDQFAVTADSSSIRLWDLQKGSLESVEDLERFHIDAQQDCGHKQSIVTMTVFEEADAAFPSVVTASADGAVLYWKLDPDYRRVLNFQKPKKNVSALISCLTSAPTKEGLVVFGAGEEKEILAWNIATGGIVAEFPERHTKLITTLVTCNMQGIGLVVISGSKDRNLISWSYKSTSVLKTFSGQHFKEITSAVVYTPRAAKGSQTQLLISTALDKRCVVWDLKLGTFIKKLSVEVAHKESIKSCEISEMSTPEGGPMLVTASLDGVIALWDVEGGGLLQSISACPRAINSIALSPPSEGEILSRILVSGGIDCNISTWALTPARTLDPLKTFEGCPRFITTGMAPYVPADGSPSVILTVGEKMIRRTNCATREQTSADITSIPKRVTSITVVSRGDPIALVGTADGKVGMWAIDSLSLVDTIDIVRDLTSKASVTSLAAYSSIEKGLWLLVVGLENKTAIVWDLLTNAALCTLACGHIAAIRAVSIIADDAPNGSKRIFAVTAGDDRTAAVWDIPSGKLVGKLANCHTKSISSIASYKNEGEPYIVMASMDSTASVWNLSNLERTKKLDGGHSGAILCVDTFVPSDQRSPIAITGSTDRSIVVWHLRRGEKLRHFPDIAQNPIAAISIYSDRDGISPIVIVSDKKNNIQVRDLYPSTFMPLHADVVRAYELDREDTPPSGAMEEGGWGRIARLSSKYRIGFWLEHGFLFKEAIKENRVDFLVKFKGMLTESLFSLRGVHSLLHRAIIKGSTEAVSTIVDCWISALRSPCTDAGAQLFWHPFHYFSLVDLKHLSQDYPELSSKVICSLQLLTASSCTLAKIKIIEPPTSPARSPIARMSSKIGTSASISPYAETATSAKSAGVVELEVKPLEEAFLGSGRQFMVGINSCKGIALWSMYSEDAELNGTIVGEGSTQPVTPMFLPLQGAATLDMLQLFVSLSETLGTTDIFESDAGKLCLQYAWDTVGSKAHLSMLMSYLLFVMVYSVAVFAFHSLREQDSFHAHRAAWVLQLAVLVFMAIYFVKQVVTYMHLKGESVWNFLFDNVWNVQDFISFFLVSAGILIRIVNLDETDESRSVLAVASILVWFKCLYYMRAYEGSGPLVAMVLKIASDIRYFVMILLIVLTGFSQAFWLISYPDETLDFGTIQNAFINSYLYMLGGFNGDFSGTVNPSLGSFLLAMFMFFMAIHMLNLLIALMGETFENVSEKKIPQWRWEQAAIILEEQEQLEILKSLRFLRGKWCSFNSLSNKNVKKKSTRDKAAAVAARRGSLTLIPDQLPTASQPQSQSKASLHRSDCIHLLRYSGDVFQNNGENLSLADVLKEISKISNDIEKSVSIPVARVDTSLRNFRDEIRLELDSIKGIVSRLGKA